MEKRAEKTTIVDVARTAGVSVGTVSRVLNGNTKVRAQLRQKVQAALDELGDAPKTGPPGRTRSRPTTPPAFAPPPSTCSTSATGASDSSPGARSSTRRANAFAATRKP